MVISAAVKADVWDAAGLSARLSVTAPDGKKKLLAEAALVNGAAEVQILVKKPQLWWPNGYGAQPLYGIEVEVVSASGVEDRKEYQLGLRTVELRREPDAWGKSFTFIVNGVSVFMKGSDWIPAEFFPHPAG